MEGVRVQGPAVDHAPHVRMTPPTDPVDHGTVYANGIEMYFDSAGEGDPLVLLHGGMASNLGWMGQIDDFSARYRVIAPERRGHGHTADSAGRYSDEQMAVDTEAFLSGLGLPPVSVVGWSDGGSPRPVRKASVSSVIC